MNWGTTRALNGIPPDSWLRVKDDYYHFKGHTPYGVPRVVKLTRRPYGRPCFRIDPVTETAVAAERVPGGMHPSTLILTVTAIGMSALIPLAMSHQDGLLTFLVTTVTAGILFLSAFLCHYAPMKPQDAIEFAEGQAAIDQAAADSAYHAWERALQNGADSARRQEAWLWAVWGQQAAINQTLNPDGDVYRPFGQSPPL